MTFVFRNTTPYLPVSIVLPSDPEALKVKLSSYLTEVSLKVNQRALGTFTTAESDTGQKWFLDTIEFRQIYQFGTIAAGATLTIPHLITDIMQFTNIYGTCITANPDLRPIPYASATAVNMQIEIFVDAVNINIINGAAAPAIISGLVVLEYLKN